MLFADGRIQREAWGMVDNVLRHCGVIANVVMSFNDCRAALVHDMVLVLM